MNDLTRREILEMTGGCIGVGAASGKVVAGPGGGKGDRQNQNRNIRGQVQSDEKYKQLKQHLVQNGWTPDASSGEFRHVSGDNGEGREFAVIPFKETNRGNKQDENRVQTVVRWDSRQDHPPSAHQLLDNEVEKILYISDGEVKTNESSLGSSIGTQNHNIGDIGGGGGSPNCDSFESSYCEDWDMSCIAIVVASAGLSCNPFTGLVTCVLGAGILTSGYIFGDGCNPCDSYATEYVEQCSPPDA